MDKSIVILGAGITGIAASYYDESDQTIIYEKDSSYGGICGNFQLDDFIFDKGIHLSFTRDSEVRYIFDKVPHRSFEPHPKNISNYRWFKHPIQNNLFSLPIEEKVKAIVSFCDKNKVSTENMNYKSWLYSKYGEYITENFFLKYTRKYWCENAENMDISWIKNRVYTPSLAEVIYGALTEDTPNTYYAKEMRYPMTGGYKEFLKPMVNNCNIVFNAEAISLDLKNKTVEFSNGDKVNYEFLVSTIPLTELTSITKDISEEIKSRAQNLRSTSAILVSLVIEGEINFDDIWFYIYDEDILPARAYLPGKKSVNNIKPGYSTIQFEIYNCETKPLKCSNEKIINNIYDFIEKAKIASKNSVILSDIRSLDHTNVIFYRDTIKNRDYIIDFYEKNQIYCAGRFGQWDYLWSDQSLLSGKNAINKIKCKVGNENRR
ncbi:protoporphyrinogen/coproporphyrinogen oxidase [Candidatus Clostridium helianthi]|uniref:Protoporphyrinogen/coproporphyrinogen oxidase n=1 Tax=Candidatus Clostridium helianthi TaxID=3381660 RepID=A0ABW8S3U5_9CLOT